ncbi:bifunctional 2-polyprenyl-6-hydroxyphenol methylase/3-demethylubiquinol 3-O-methyltransferase UbiG [Salinarimonas ramus]|uniref:Ubiquinone biosynthesis O-methyltransferase n=1 Tax=Salinarimonas ramus TaxID=690164 RepID=A0A917QCD1_9HYPH|nr:bifunctional 2-polyprenyl-6-hydroxyphenol methylase/3-demethylubiquinol 3-O-methyltransferase UbiG [Salinarimonas ramus]GGK40553.1 ubiquinone biosynthesis O-methyltransferase [Salinarimonas ramus]
MSAADPRLNEAAAVDPDEVARFERIARTWWDPKGPMRTLHKFNPVRLSYIRDRVAEQFGRDPRDGAPLEGLTLLDVGCGGGLLTEPLARLGADAKGLDPAPTNVEVARLHAARSGVPVSYAQETVETVVERGERFDVVIAMEVVEHVPDPDAFVRTCAQAVKPGGLLFMATINRTLKAWGLAIVGAEYVLGWLPKGTHEWDKFVTPDELETSMRAGGLAVRDVTGVTYNPLKDAWGISRDTAVNYMAYAERPEG